MKKFSILALCLALLLGTVANAEVLTGKDEGFGGALVVEVTMDGETITDVKVVENAETKEIAGAALEEIPAAIVAANSTEVDVVAGATVTSTAIIAAVNNALNPSDAAEEAVEEAPAELPEADAYIGVGVDSMGRIGPGKDATDTQVYSFNQVIAAVIFDAEGRILDAQIDQVEVATPNYDGEGMPHFSGFPGQGGYNWDENHDETITGKTEDTEENFTAEVSSWQTKRERGDSYKMGTGTWAQQMDRYEALFIGKTVEEIDEWFASYTAANGRPLKEGLEGDDAAKYEALSDDEKAMLADVTSAATMSLFDGHGNILAALHRAYWNRAPLEIELAK